MKIYIVESKEAVTNCKSLEGVYPGATLAIQRALEVATGEWSDITVIVTKTEMGDCSEKHVLCTISGLLGAEPVDDAPSTFGDLLRAAAESEA